MILYKIFIKIERNFWFIFYFPKKQILLRILIILKRILQEKRNIYLENLPSYLKKNIYYKWNFNNLRIDSRIEKNPQNKKFPILLNLAGYKYRLNLTNDWDFQNIPDISLLQKMHLHYMNYLNELNNDSGKTIILDWIKKVKPYSRSYWSYSWNSYSLSIRVVNWIDFISINSDYIKEKDLKIIKKSIIIQVRFLFYNLEVDIRGNHLIKNIRCLFKAASLFINNESKKWFIKASDLLETELDHQIMKDGMHFELSHSYHIQIFEDLLDIRRSLININKTNYWNLNINKKLLIKLDEKIKNMIRPLHYLTHPDGKACLLSDGGINMSTSPKKLLLIAKKEIGYVNYPTLSQNAAWQLFSSGYYGYKSENSTFIVNCGQTCAQDLPAHGQGDALSFEWSLNKTRFIVDTGVYEYKAGIKRSFSRSTAAHNTLTINNLNQSQFWSSFRTGRRAKTFVNYWKKNKSGFAIEAYHDGYKLLKGKPIVTRKINFHTKYLKVTDSVNKKIFNQKINSRILFSPFVKFGKIIKNKKGNYFCQISLKCKDNSNKNLKFIFETDTNFVIKPALWFPDFGISIKTSRIVMIFNSKQKKATWSIKFSE